jgi:aminomethyltransferase
VSLNGKGDFVGRAALESGEPADPASDFAGRVLVGLTSAGKRAARAGYAVYASAEGGERIGVVTSGALSPTLGYPIALAYVDADHAEPGAELHLDVRGTRLPGTVTPLPFYRRSER